MISKASLASEGAGNVHSAEEGSAVEPRVRAGIVGCLQELSLNTRMVPLVNDVIQAVSLREHVNLSKRKKQKILTNFYFNYNLEYENREVIVWCQNMI